LRSDGTVRFGLVGCGKIARKHAAALAQVSGAVLAGACDADPARADAFARERGVRSFPSLGAMLAEGDLDAACVLTPSGLHAEVAREVAAAGRHVVVEKPLVLRAGEGRELVSFCDARGVGLFVVNQNRCNLPVVRLREAMEAGRLGRPVLGSARVRWRRTQEYYDEAAWRGTWRLDGGVLANQALHHVDMLLWLMGEVESVQAFAATRLLSVEVEDTAVAAIRFRSGALGTIEATTAARPKDLEGSISVLGEGGSVEIGGFAMDELRTWQFAHPLPSDEEVLRTSARNPAGFGWNHARFLESVAERIRSGRIDAEDGREACRVVDLLDALYDSAASGRAVRPGEALGLSRLGRGDA